MYFSLAHIPRIFDIDECSPFVFHNVAVVVAIVSVLVRMWRLWFLYHAALEGLAGAKDNSEHTRSSRAELTTRGAQPEARDITLGVQTETSVIPVQSIDALLAAFDEDRDDGWFSRHRHWISDLYLTGVVGAISIVYFILIVVRVFACVCIWPWRY